MAFRGWEKDDLTLPDGRVVDAICPVIVSVSRATDIPAFFSPWFSNRLRAGYMRWTNPFNANQVQYVSFQDTRVFVFWSKNPKPLTQFLPELDAKGINYYFQFTLNDYEKEGLEPNVPPLMQRVETFKLLSERLGKKRVIWRYDPLILTDNLCVDALVDRTRKGGAEIVSFLKTGSAYYAPSAAAATMVRAVIEDSGAELPVCAWMEGQYGIDDVYLGVIARLGRNGVEEVLEVELTDIERAGLIEAAAAVKEKVSDLDELSL
jgi:hypothetical protein